MNDKEPLTRLENPSMCIQTPTKKGIDKLPKIGTYYKALREDGLSPYQYFYYPKGLTVNILEVPQCVNDRYGFPKNRCTLLGGHFFVRKEDAINYRRGSDVLVCATFKIRRENITHIGQTMRLGFSVPTIIATKARRIS